MGSHPKIINQEDLKTAIKNFTFPKDLCKNRNPIKDTDIEIRTQIIRVEQREKIDYKNDPPRAAHIHVPLKGFRKTFCHLVKIFSNYNKIGFPLGQEMYFVPNTIDPRIAISKERMSNVKKWEKDKKCGWKKSVSYNRGQ